jgi:hypothetical protein
MEWVAGIQDNTGNTQEVRSLLPYAGASSADLFATSIRGIWAAGTSSEDPDLEIEFASQSGNAGYGISTNVVVSGGHYLVYCDEVNGTYVYNGVSWSKVTMGNGAGQIAGVDPAHLVFCTVFKDRLWFVEKSTASAWYLPLGQISGAASEFPMGLKFAHGGTLVGLWSWTYDGGSGSDDSLVALSSSGDVLVWQGTDPSDPDFFGLKGVWFVDKPPAGRRVASDFGGDLLLLTRQGVTAMSRLVVGIPDARAEQLTAKIANLFASLMDSRADTLGWSLVKHPEDNTLLITVPLGSDGVSYQLVQSVASKGWFLYRDLDMRCATSWDGGLYFGDGAASVWRNTGYVDGIRLSDPNTFTPIDWGLITAFSDLGEPAQKQVQLLRPLLKAEGTTPSVSVNARYEYNTDELDPVALIFGTEGSLWDVAEWDVDMWSGDLPPVSPVRGATGMGTAVAVAVRGTSTTRTVLVGVRVLFTSGGFL